MTTTAIYKKESPLYNLERLFQRKSNSEYQKHRELFNTCTKQIISNIVLSVDVTAGTAKAENDKYIMIVEYSKSGKAVSITVTEKPEQAQPEQAQPEADHRSPEQVKAEEHKTVTENGAPASIEDRRAEQAQTLDMLFNLKVGTGKAEKINALRAEIAEISRDIMEEIHDKGTRTTYGAGKRTAQVWTLGNKETDKANLSKYEELKERREALRLELAILLTNDSNNSQYATGAEWLKANAELAQATAPGTRKASNVEALTDAVMTPVRAIVFKFACKFRMRQSADILYITESGKIIPAQNYEEYITEVYTELYSRCIDNPADEFLTLLVISAKEGIKNQWKRTHNRHTDKDPETGKRTERPVEHISYENMIHAPGDGTDGQPDEGENPAGELFTDNYSNTALKAINNMLCDEICRDRKPEDLQVLKKIAYGVEIKHNSAEEKRRTRLKKRIRAEYPELIQKQRTPEQMKADREKFRVMPYIKFKYYAPAQKPETIHRYTHILTDGEYAGTIIKGYYVRPKAEYIKAGEQPEAEKKARKIDRTAEANAVKAHAEAVQIENGWKNARRAIIANAKRRELLEAHKAKGHRLLTGKAYTPEPLRREEVKPFGSDEMRRLEERCRKHAEKEAEIRKAKARHEWLNSPEADTLYGWNPEKQEYEKDWA